jgi:hypothetical protein
MSSVRTLTVQLKGQKARIDELEKRYRGIEGEFTDLIELLAEWQSFGYDIEGSLTERHQLVVVLQPKTDTMLRKLTTSVSCGSTT